MTSDNPAYQQPAADRTGVKTPLDLARQMLTLRDDEIPADVTNALDLLAARVVELEQQLAAEIGRADGSDHDRDAAYVHQCASDGAAAELRATVAGQLDEALTLLRQMAGRFWADVNDALSATRGVPVSQPTTEDSSAGSGELRTESEATGDDATEAITAHDLDIGADSDGQAELRCPAAHCSHHWTDLDNGTTIRELIRLADEHIASHHTPADSSGEATA